MGKIPEMYRKNTCNKNVPGIHVTTLWQPLGIQDDILRFGVPNFRDFHSMKPFAHLTEPD